MPASTLESSDSEFKGAQLEDFLEDVTDAEDQEEEDPEELDPEEEEYDPEEEEYDPEEEEDPAFDCHSTPKHNNDFSQEVNSEWDNDDLRFENSKESRAGVRRTSGDHCHSVNPLNELLDTQVRVIPHVGAKDIEPQNLRSLVSSEDREFHEFLSDNKGAGSQLENRIVIDACIDVQSECNEECDIQSILNNIICMDDGKIKSIPVNREKIAVESLMVENSAGKVSTSNLSVKEETKKMDLLAREDIKAKTSRSMTSQIRPRSYGATYEDGNKRPAVLCELFAGGWCMKGNSCKFIHHKDGVISTNKCDRQDPPIANSKDNLEENKGLRVENRKSFVLSEPLTSSMVYDRSLMPLETIKTGVYGKNQRPHQFLDDHGMHMSPVPNIVASELKSSAAEENITYCEPSWCRDNHNHSPNIVGHTGPDSEKFVEGYTLSRNRLVQIVREHGSSGSHTQLRVSGNINPSASEKYGSHTPPQFLYPLSPEFDASLPCNSLPYTHKCSGTAISRLPSLDGDQEYSSRSLQLVHSSASYNSRLDTENMSLHDVPGPTSTRLGAQSNISKWEPSIPFRPSFSFSSFISSPGNQYDPLLDSIDSPDKTFQVIQGEIVHNSQLENASNVCFHQQPLYGLDKSMSIHGKGASRTSPAMPRTFIYEHLNKSCVFKEENPLKPFHIGNTSNVIGVDRYLSSSHADRNEHKESKALKHFRASLVIFVKELVKPYWIGGNLSKDAHNTVVRRAVEKVTNALQPQQIPNTVESITQYISSSRRKLTKLVELYVRKYAKS